MVLNMKVDGGYIENVSRNIYYKVRQRKIASDH